jgi:hypothetical protein
MRENKSVLRDVIETDQPEKESLTIHFYGFFRDFDNLGHSEEVWVIATSLPRS